MQVETGNVLPEANERKTEKKRLWNLFTCANVGRKETKHRHTEEGSVEIGRHLTKF